MLLEFLFGLITFVLTWDYLYKKRCNDIFKKYKVPGPNAYPIVGSAFSMKDVNTETIIDFLIDCRNKYGKVFRFWNLHEPSIEIMDAKYMEAVLSSQQLIKKSSFYDFVQSWLGTGLLLSTGKKWHARRKIITPTFHFKILEQFVEVFDQQSAVLVQKLQAKADGTTAINIFPIVCLSALDIIAETAMGVKINAQKNPDFEYVKAVAQAASITGARFVSPFHYSDILFKLTAPEAYRSLCQSIAIMHNFTDKVIEERRESLTKSIADGSLKSGTIEDIDIGSKRRMALLDVLLQSTIEGQPLSNADIREEVDTFMFEGHDTTTSGISFCLYLISRHSEVQEKIVQEIIQVLGTDKSRNISYRDLQELKYLECVIKESQRLFPSVPMIGRMTTEDIKLVDIIVPANTHISLHLISMMRDPDYFSEPDSFQPERFSSEATEKINPFAYVPFSAGPRNCIGQKFAMLEMKSTISKVLRHFELLPLGPEVRPTIDLILRSASGVHVGLKPRIISE